MIAKRGITLLESVRKVSAMILLNRLINNICPLAISKAQSDFKADRDMMDMIISVRNLQEKCIKRRVVLYSVFVDLAYYMPVLCIQVFRNVCLLRHKPSPL